MSFFLALSAIVGFFLFVALLLVFVRVFPRVSALIVAWIFGTNLTIYLSAILSESGGWEFLKPFAIFGMAVLAILSILGLILDIAFSKEGWEDFKRDLENFGR